MANFHLRDKSLSLKAVGLLSKMLSFNDGWKFSTKGLSAICKEGPDAILSALRELEKHGYLVRHRQRDGKGRMSSTIFEIYEEPQESTPEREMPHTGNPCVEKPDVDNPHGDKSAQINTDQVITQERNTLSKNYQSINLDGMDRMDERSEYEEIIKENLDYDILCQDPKFDKDRFREIMDIMLDAVCSTAPTIRINGEDMPQQVVKSRFLKLNSSHIEYVLEAMNKNPSDIRNIRAYLLTALYNASLTIDNYYSALVNHDFYGQDRLAGSKPICRRALTIWPVVALSAGSWKASAQATRTAGATWTTVVISGSARASSTRLVSSRAVRAPVGQWVTHWPQKVQSLSLR